MLIYAMLQRFTEWALASKFWTVLV